MRATEQAEIDIMATPQLLAFAGSELHAGVLQAYRTAIKKRFVHYMDDLKQHDGQHHEQLTQLLTQLGDASFHESLMYPECNHVLYFRSRTLKDGMLRAARYFTRTFEAELARKEGQYNIEAYSHLWTMLGDFLIQYDQEEADYMAYEAPRLYGKVPVDFFSPFNRKITTEDLEQHQAHAMDTYPSDEWAGLFQQLEESLAPLEGRSRSFLDFILDFTQVILIKLTKGANGNRDSRRQSASLFTYNGRVLLANIHASTPAELLDFMLHEAVHSYLYMMDEISHWSPAATVLEAGTTHVSHWSGRTLNIRTYLHAVLVYYSLFQLWGYALEEGLYNEAWVSQRYAQVKKGFAQVNVAALNQAKKLGMAPNVAAMFDDLASMVVRS